MNNLAWERVKAVFNAVLDAGQDGSTVLDRMCADNDALRAEVESLLSFSGAPVLRTAGAAKAVARMSMSSFSGPGIREGECVGPYKLIRLLGEGTYGFVFLAQQSQPIARQVALKIIKPRMASLQALARFERERQALAAMDHPHIAKIFDAGVTERELPYFVMEYIDGFPITEYCDRNRLTLRKRLALFLEACIGVQHVHAKGFIHRDLKPQNILVSTHKHPAANAARTVIIDFGVAAALTPSHDPNTRYTLEGQLVGTPEYMSPEQADSTESGIDARSDVYSLGVVLYELLTGMIPLDTQSLREAGLAAIRKAIREVEPPRPSIRLSALGEAPKGVAAARHSRLEDLRSQLRRELEWIPLKALRKDRSERYQSVSELADDVRNYLAYRPLIAGPETRTYRVRKLVRRNKGFVTATTLVLLALSGGLTTTLWQAREAHLTARLAIDRAEELAVSATEHRRLASSEAEAHRIAGAQSEHVIREKYFAAIIGAGAAIDAGEWTKARLLLAQASERYRHWEWGYLHSLCDGSLSTLAGHTGSVRTAACSPDGSRVLTASWDGTARIWNAVNGADLVVLRDHGGYVNTAAFSEDGLTAVTASDDGTARLWQVQTGRPLVVLRGHSKRVTMASFSNDNMHVVTASDDGTACLWNASGGQLLSTLRGHHGPIRLAHFSEDGRYVVTASDDTTARVWDVASGVETATLSGHDRSVNSASFNASGSRIVTASDDGTARVWETATGQTLAVLRGHGGWVRCATFSADSTHIVTASNDATSRLWHAESGDCLTTMRGHSGAVHSASMSGNGTRVVTASDDGTARVWDAADGHVLAILRGHEGCVNTAAFFRHDTCVLTSSDDGSARIWASSDVDAETVNVVGPGMTFRPRDRAATEVTGSGGRVAVLGPGDTVVRIVDRASGAEVTVLRGHEAEVNSVTFSHDGSRIVTASNDRTARVWEADSGKELVALRGSPHALSFACFGENGTSIGTFASDNSYREWSSLPLRSRLTEARIKALLR